MPLSREAWRNLLRIGVSAGALVGIFLVMDWGQAREVLSRADVSTIAALIMLYIGDRVFMAWKWYLLARGAEDTPPLGASTRIYLASSAVGVFLPLGGLGPDIVRVAMLTRRGMRAERAVGSILVERLCGIVGAALMMMTAVALLLVIAPGSPVARWLQDTTRLWPWAVGGAAVLALLAVLAVKLRLGTRLAERLHAIPRLRSYVHAVTDYGPRRGLLATSVLLSWLEQWAPIVAFYIAFRGFDVPLPLLTCAAIVPLGSILERLPISVGGIGVREAGLGLAAAAFGVPAADAFLVSLLEHTVFLLSMAPLALLYLVDRTPRTGAPEGGVRT